jgi:ParB/RepB/Spo0J family partition protein
MKIPIEQFYVESDYRFEETDITNLGVSIRNTGLHQPILVKQTPKGFEVCAGRRRLRALRDFCGYTELEQGKHFIINPSVDALVSQLEENDHREDFTVQEKSCLIKDIHTQGIKHHGKAIQGNVTEGWSLSHTAKRIGRDVSYVSRMLLINENLHLVKDCTTITECLNRIKRENENFALDIVRKTKAKKVKYTGNIEKYFSNVTASPIEKYLPQLEDELIDFIFIDPPFAINYDKLLDTDYYDIPYDDEPEEIISLLKTIIPHLYRVLKNNKYMVMWCDFNLFAEIRTWLHDSGFKTSAIPLIWVKMGTAGKTKQPHLKPGSATQFAVLAWKGNPELSIKGCANYFPHEIVRKDRIHRAQMPESLIVEFMKIFSNEADLVFDGFAGGLSSLRAAFLTKRRWIGCEKYEANIEDGKSFTMKWLEEKK